MAAGLFVRTDEVNMIYRTAVSHVVGTRQLSREKALMIGALSDHDFGISVRVAEQPSPESGAQP